MDRSRIRWRRTAVAVGVVLMVAVGSVWTGPVAAAGGGDRGSGGGNAQLGTLSAAWWKYVLAQPAATNPLLDASGSGCDAGQSGPVFFLVGTYIGPVVRTECKVPRGKSLFFPMANSINLHVDPSLWWETPAYLWWEMHVKRGFAVKDLYARVDSNVLVKSAAPDAATRGCVGPDRACGQRSFSVDVPPDNLLGVGKGTYRPAISDGNYVLIPPLPPGKHTVVFKGTVLSKDDDDFVQDVTYEFTIK